MARTISFKAYRFSNFPLILSVKGSLSFIAVRSYFMRSNDRRSHRIKLLAAAFIAAVGILGFAERFEPDTAARASAFGPSASHTGAPLEDNCASCHSGTPVNTGGGSVSISGVPANYLPGQQYPVTVTTAQSDGVVFGFQMTAIDSLGREVGDYVIPPMTPDRMQTITGLVGGNVRRYIEHTSDGITPTQFGTNSWTFNWTAPASRVGKISFYAAGNAANSDGSPGGDKIYTTSRATLSGSAISNFDTDGRSDVSVWRPSTGTWYSLGSSGTYQVAVFGVSGDKITPGDYDGDGRTDYSVWRPSTGVWYINKSGGGFQATNFGQSGDIPVPGDYDGDLKTDIAVFRPSNGTWYILGSTGIYRERAFGVSGDKPVQADFDADGKTDIAVWRPSTGVWYAIPSATNGFTANTFGVNGDQPVEADYDGDGKADLAIFRPSTGTWYILGTTQGYRVVNFGVATDKPSPADYDGDGKTDIAVFRDGTWYIQGSNGPTFLVYNFGQAGDVAVPTGYLPE